MFTGTTPPEVRNLLGEVLKDDCNLISIPFDDFIKSMTHIKTELNIKSNSVAFLKMMNICNDYLKNRPKEEK